MKNKNIINKKVIKKKIGALIFLSSFILFLLILNIYFIFGQTFSGGYNTNYYGSNYPNANYPTTNYPPTNNPPTNYNSNYYNNGYYSGGNYYGGNNPPTNYNTGNFYGGSGYYGGGNYGSGFYPSNGYSVYGSSVNPQFSDPDYNNYYGNTPTSVFWPNFNAQDCLARQDVFIQIAPGGCSPAVVRSDLLEEQNVPIFCKVMSIQANPLIDLTRVRSIYFQGEYPKGISGISYFPARAALQAQLSYREKSIVSSPVNPDMGYLVIVLSRHENESAMPDYIEGNITAAIEYDSVGAFGIGRTNFYVSEMSDVEWVSNYKQYGFWNGKAYIRADSIEQDRATLSLYRDMNSKIASVTLRPGEISRDIYLTGYYCGAGLNIQLESLQAPLESALLQINNEQIWVSKGDRIIDDRCRIVNLETYGSGGRISISCPSRSGNFDLILNPGKARFKFGAQSKEVVIGDKLDSRNIFLAYLGQDINNKRYAVLVRDEFSLSRVGFADKQVYEALQNSIGNGKRDFPQLKEIIKRTITDQYKRKLSFEASRSIDSQVEVQVIKEGENAFGVDLEEVLIAKNKEWNVDEIPTQDVLAKGYYDKSIKAYEDLKSFYPNEKRIPSEDPYAAAGLYEAARLSKSFGMNQKAQDYYNKIVTDYPNSNIASRVSIEKDYINKYDTALSRTNVILDNTNYIIELLDFKKPSRSDASAVVLIDGKEETMGISDIKTIQFQNETRTLQLIAIDDDYVTIKYDRSGPRIQSYSRTDRAGIRSERNQISFDGINFKVLNINLKKQAKIIILPKAFGPQARSSFMFKVGIEKRAIKLSPEKTKEMIENLQKAIKQWSEINDKLGKIITVMKAACFVTSAMLTVKNLLSGLSGESYSRNKLMTSTGGWNDVCTRLVSEKKYQTLQQCLLDKNSEIEKDIQIYTSGVKGTNDIMSQIQKEVGVKSGDILDFQGQVDSKKVEEKFKERFDEFCRGAEGDVVLSNKEKTKLSMSEVCRMSGNMTHEQRRDIYTMYNVRQAGGGSEALRSIVDKQLGDSVLEAKNYYETSNARIRAEADANRNNLDLRTLIPAGDNVVYGDIKRITRGDSQNQVYSNFREGNSVVRVFIPYKKDFGRIAFVANPEVAGKEVIVQVAETPGQRNNFIPNGSIYTIDGKAISVNASNSVREYMSLSRMDRITQIDTKSYHNPIAEPDKLMVKYFDRAPYKGLPAEVPFDVNEGWYVEMTYVLSGFGRPYDESGRVVNFYICNVGPNGLIEFKKSGDDICRYYNGETGADLNFPGLSASDSNKLVQKAQQAIYDAAKQYGKERVTINGRTFKSGVSFGGNEGRCTDFMSPQDCNIMFNVCDPVICPASRCDLGGQYRVDNVIQSGIVGSLVLCLPNIKEGVAIPICLTGVHAGIEGYLSILNSTVKCLNESLVTGRNVGICDEIKSIYLCEFFWRQAAPLLNILIPRVLESLYNQGARGGGEYLTVQSAWENTRSAVDYFKNQYAVNSMAAFSARSTEGISTTDMGAEFCKSFVSMSGTNAKDFFNRLIEPDSPTQFHAWFSESVLTTATIPPTSHYKVYYHIYAGKDMGSYYSIYLKDSSQGGINTFSGGSYGGSGSNYYGGSGGYSSGINSIGYMVVATGYVPRGSEVDEARDFTGPAGYKQLCVNINGKDECGFGTVSTSYALNSLSDAYAQEQLKTGITSEKECIAGSSSTYSLAQPNLQAGVQSMIEPQLYNKGIIRVCASQNPGKQVLPSGEYDKTNSSYDRWKEVGYCDDPTIKCWIDTNSVKNVIKDKQVLQGALGQIDLNRLGVEDYLSEEASVTIANNAEEFIKSLVITSGESKDSIENKISTIVSNLNKLISIGSNNVHRARGLYLLANLYRAVAEGVRSRQTIPTVTTTGTGVSTSVDAGSSGSGGTTNIPLDKKLEDIIYSNQNKLYIKVYENGQEKSYEIENYIPSLEIVKLVGIGYKKPVKNPDGNFSLRDLTTDENQALNKFIKENSQPLDIVVPPKGKSESTSKWKDEMLKDKVTIKVNYVSGSRVYRYSKPEGWFSDDSDFINIAKDKNFNYIDGVNYIAEQTNFMNYVVIGSNVIDNNLFESNEQMADKMFEALV